MSLPQNNIPLSRPDHPDDPAALLTTLREIVLSGRWTQGQYATAFEQRVAELCGSVYAIATNSGTSALDTICAVAGLGPGTQVICPSYTFVATINAVLSVGATPIFADIEPQTYNLDLEDTEAKLTQKTRAILLVHQFGIPADADAFSKFCHQRDLVLIEDVACGLGSKHSEKAIGTFGLAGILSFHPRKVLSTGEGGMILTDDENLAQKARSFGNHGKNLEKFSQCVGHNFRMSEFQAALGLWALDHVSEAISRRTSLAKRYEEAFRSHHGLSLILERGRTEWNLQSYPVRILEEKRDLIQETLAKEGIETSQGPLPAHMHPYVDALMHPPRLPQTERAYEETLLLPMYAALTYDQQDKVIESLYKALK